MPSGTSIAPPRCHPPPDGGTLRHVNNSLPGPVSEGSVHGNGSRQPDNWLLALAEPFVTVPAHGNGVTDSISGQRRRRKYQRPTEGERRAIIDAHLADDDRKRDLKKRGTAWSIFARYQYTGEVVCRPRGSAQHHRLDDENKDLLVMCLEDNPQLTLKHLALILQQSGCQRRGRRCRYARRLTSPQSPGRHLDCHAVGDWRPGRRSMPALKHVLA